ncbi:glutathione S-transferase [Veronia nyctiphanis]|uniref:Glutathione S-transferase n=1 Tax=Veronia nyctiphanis TaxID=1278244 RepID=A0A4Q0YGV2_9GAMM|nr:glutathione S-transferase family protein [Veronia nyctiphanis]RXJ69465.1 glutathione S-transferase [Veronia nyctiphanis]
MHLIIANKNYSSWSLRGWLMLTGFDLEFEETILPLFTDDFYSEIKRYSPVAKVPVLVDKELAIWDSLAIAEYVNETYLKGKGWPESAAERAKARSLSAEMHSGFPALRDEMPMNCRAMRKVSPSEQCQLDIKRIESIWTEQREQSSGNGEWLFGQFSMVDCMYAPVALRFKTYGVTLNPIAAKYMETVLQSQPVQRWLKESLEDTSIVSEDEAGVNI